jgi:predicted aspartyl protease
VPPPSSPRWWFACIPPICALLFALSSCAQSGAGCDLEPVAQVPLQAKGRLFAVPVTIDGHEISMLLDSGGARSMLVQATVERLKIPQDGRTFTVMVGLGGGSPRPDANVDSMRLGSEQLSVDRIPVNNFNGTIGIDGVLGLDILRDYDLDIDEPGRTLTLYRAQRCDGAEPPWVANAVQVEHVATLGSWMETPLEVDGVSGVAAVDTGASSTMIMPGMVRRLGLTEQDMSNDRSVKLHVVARDDAQARVHRFSTIRIGPVTAHDASILVLTQQPPALEAGGTSTTASLARICCVVGESGSRFGAVACSCRVMPGMLHWSPLATDCPRR